MRQNILRTPLINSAIVLVVLSLLVYFTLTSPDGSVWSSIGAIILLIFRTAQLVVGLALGLLVCFAVLVGIFLGAVALFDSSAATRMYEGLREMIIAWTAPVAGLFRSDREALLEARLQDLAAGLRQESDRRVQDLSSQMTGLRQELDQGVRSLGSRLSAMEERVGELVAREELDSLRQEFAEGMESFKKLESSVAGLEKKIGELAAQKIEIDAASILGDIPQRLEKVEEQEIPEPVDLEPVEQTISGLRDELSRLAAIVEGLNVSTGQQESADTASEAGEEPEHRLLSYFDEAQDRARLTELVASTLKKDMTYAQVMEFLAKEMGTEKGKIITDHPSLAKDFIRQMRRRA